MQGKQGNLSVVEDGECTIVASQVLEKREERFYDRALTGFVGSFTTESD